MKELAEKHGAKLGTLKSRASREKWLSNHDKKVATKKATERKKVATRKELELVIENDDLTEQQKMFCLFYLQHFNATKAYQQAYDCDYKTAHSVSYRLLAKVGIKKEIKRLKAELQQDMMVDVKDLMQEYVKQAFANINDVVKVELTEHHLNDKNGNKLIDMKGNPVTGYFNDVYVNPSDQFDGSLIKRISQGRDGINIEMYDKQKAMQELYKYVSGGDDENTGVVFVDNEEAMNQYMAEHGEAYAD